MIDKNSSQAVKVAYILAHLIVDLALIYVAVWGPTLVVSLFAGLLLVLSGMAYTKRLNSWGDCGQV